ncbi:MAG: electron transport complex subunit RsxA [Eubacterium sp.]
MKEVILIAIGSAIVNNVVLSQFLGLCPFFGVSKKVNTAAGMGVAVIFVITIPSFVTDVLDKFIFQPKFDLTYLQTIVFILVIAALVQFVEMFLKKSMPPLYNSLGVFLPLITTNCAVLGVALTNVQKGYGIGVSTINGIATAVGFTIAIVIMAGIREKIEYNDIPTPFKGSAIVLVTAGLMAIAFMGFSGVI